MSQDFLDPPPEEQNIVLIDSETLQKAESLIESCERCNPTGAALPFDWILDQLTGRPGAITDYLLESSARCPVCRAEVRVTTLVKPE